MYSKTDAFLETVPHHTQACPFSIHHTYIAPEESNALYSHYHPEAEFFFLEEGELLFTVENQDYILSSGDGIFIPPNLIHSARRSVSTGIPCVYRAVVFSLSLLEQCCMDSMRYLAPIYQNKAACICHLPSCDERNKHLLQHLFSVFSNYREPLDACELAITGHLLLCWQEIYILYFSAQYTEMINPLQPGLQKSIEYMKVHYNSALTLSDLAATAGLSNGYFCHSFKEFTGYSPFEYLNRLRIMKSCELLGNSTKKITEIATLCGYNNISYFNRVFYQIAGQSPSAYRKNNLQSLSG